MMEMRLGTMRTAHGLALVPLGWNELDQHRVGHGLTGQRRAGRSERYWHAHALGQWQYSLHLVLGRYLDHYNHRDPIIQTIIAIQPINRDIPYQVHVGRDWLGLGTDQAEERVDRTRHRSRTPVVGEGRVSRGSRRRSSSPLMQTLRRPTVSVEASMVWPACDERATRSSCGCERRVARPM